MSRSRPAALHPECAGLAATDTGLRAGAANRDLDRGQLVWSRTHHAALLRLHRSQSSVWLGAHEHALEAVRGAFCRTHGIPILRRLTGGDAGYRDPRQWNFTLTVPLRTGAAHHRLGPWPERLGRALRAALRTFGFETRFVAPHHIELDGRTLGEVFVAIRAGVLVAEAHLFRGIDADTMLRALCVPKEKLTPEGIRSARRRFAVLDHPGRPSPADAALLAAVQAACAAHLGLAPAATVPACRPARPRPEGDGPPRCVDDDTLRGFVRTPVGVLYGALRPDRAGDRIESLSLHGDVQLHPHRLFRHLNRALRGVPLDQASERLAGVLARRPHELLGFTDADLKRLLRLLLGRRVLQSRLGLSAAEAATVMLHDPTGTADTPALLKRARLLLVPYCAKPTWCKWRHRDGCPECGRCTVGAAYRLARARGMQVRTIRNFEHLQATLTAVGASGAEAYIGLCCRHFFIKREYAFRAVGIPAVLLDIAGANCYELQQEELAYAGRFEAQAELDLPILAKIMAAVPACGAPIPARGRRHGTEATGIDDGGTTRTGAARP